MVQQSMMETVFLLVGFSGDDPNFLHWSGWVRDNLGGAAKNREATWLVPSSFSVHIYRGRLPDLSTKVRPFRKWHLQHQYGN